MIAPPAVRVPTARSLRSHLARTRRARRAATADGPSRDWYTPALAALVVGGMLVQGVRRVVGVVPAPPPEAPHAGLLLGAALLVLAGLALRAALAVGPMLAGPAVRHWVLAAPVDRRGLLTPRYAGAAAAAAVLGAGVGALAGVVVAAAATALIWWTATGAAVGAGLLAAAVLWQSGRVAAGRATGAGIAVAGLLVAVAALVAGRDAAVPAGPGVPGAAVAAVAWLVAAALLGCGWRRLARLDRAELGAGSGLAAAVRVAGTFLDPSLLLGLVEERRWRSARRGRSRPGAGTGTVALLHADARRALRTPTAVGVAVGMLLVPYAATAVLPAPAVPAVTAVAAWAVASRVAGGLRAVARSAALRRALGGTDRVLVAAHLVAPLAAVTVWTLAVLPAVSPLNPVAAVLLPVGAVAVVWRAATRPGPDYGSALFETGLGMMPVDTVRQLLRGPALLAALAGVQLLLAR